MRAVKSIGINYDKLSYAIFSPIGGLGLIAGITKNDYPYVNNGQFFAFVIFLSIALTIYFFLKSFNVLVVNSIGIELKYLLLPLKSVKKRWSQIDNYAIVKIKRQGGKKQITYSRSEIWFIDANDIVLLKTYIKGRTNINEVIAMINRFLSKTVIDLEKTNHYPLSKSKSKVIYKEKLTK